MLQQIISYYPTLQTSFSPIKRIYAGSLLKPPVRWSPISLPYIKAIKGTAVTVDGFAANFDCTLYWIAVSVERPAYDAQTTVSSSHIRYLVGCRDPGLGGSRLHDHGAQQPVDRLQRLADPRHQPHGRRRGL